MKSIVLAGGCFWGLQKFYEQFPGIHTEVGYANGGCAHPSYEQVCRGSGHAEAVKISYPDDVDLCQILAVFFMVVNPVSLNRQGNDVGINYRSGIYYTDAAEERVARIMIRDLQRHFDQPIVVEVLPLAHFYPAEEYHQFYLDKNPGGYCHLPPAALYGHALPDVQQVEALYPGLASMD